MTQRVSFFIRLMLVLNLMRKMAGGDINCLFHIVLSVLTSRKLPMGFVPNSESFFDDQNFLLVIHNKPSNTDKVVGKGRNL